MIGELVDVRWQWPLELHMIKYWEIIYIDGYMGWTQTFFDILLISLKHIQTMRLYNCIFLG